MPAPKLPPELKPVVSRFTSDNRLQLKQADTQRVVQQLGDYGRTLRPGVQQADSPASQQAAQQMLGWVQRLPPDLVDHAAAPVVALQALPAAKAHVAMVEGLQVLTLGAKALLAAGQPPDKRLPQTLLQVAFGSDAASLALRKPLPDLKAPGLPSLPGPKTPGLPDLNLPGWPGLNGLDQLPNIDKLLQEGTLRELLRSFAECGHAAQMERDWVAQVRPWGQVTALKTDRPCAGGTLQIGYAGFGPKPPDPARVADILLSLPTLNGCQHLRLRELDPGFFDPARWADSGVLSVLLPAEISSGAVGFFSLPPPFEGGGPCTGGSLASAAGMFQSLLAQHWGAYGVQFGQQVVDAAGRAEAGRHRPLPCASLQSDGRNALAAGPPVIHGFVVVEQGDIHPRGTVTLEWSSANAQTLEIVALELPGSEHPHELPKHIGPLKPHGRITLAVPCSRRWEAQLVLRASNDNGCSKPAQAAVALRSGFSHYRLACAKANITDRRPGLGMAGFAYKRQKTSGAVLGEQFARAFVVEENSLAPDRQRLVLVVADIWTCTQIVKRSVIQRLNQRFNRPASSPVVDEHSLLVAGTHTHAGPGGYSEYALYNLTAGGFDQGVFDTIVNGICDAVAYALSQLRPGRLYVQAGELADVGANRSLEAYQRNPEYAAGADRSQWTDRDMLLLKFMVDRDNRGGQRAIGALNWHALHPTSLGQFNTSISGDNKGEAERLFEAEMLARAQPGDGFVAAFGNACAGDVSGNLELDDKGRATAFKPLGGDLLLAGVLPLVPSKRPLDGAVVPPLVRLPDAWQRDQARMQLLGTRQFKHALALYDSASQELTGPLAARQVFVDMASRVPILAKPGQSTWPAALGVSFGAGSSEDSIAYASVGPLDIDAAILEGITRDRFTEGGVQAWATGLLLLGAQAPVMALALSGGIVPVGPALGVLLQAIALMPAMPLARSYFFGSLAPLLLPGELEDQRPQLPGQTTAWQLPLPHQLPADMVAGQGVKPVMFAAGSAVLRCQPEAGGQAIDKPCPLVPNVLPLQLLRIGSVALAAVPAEFTATAGRRLKARLHQAFGGQLSHVAVSNYSNGYSGYVATEEEYGAQHYEGASTLYGPHTLEAYLQSFDALALQLQGKDAPVPGASRAFEVPAIFRKPSAP